MRVLDIRGDGATLGSTPVDMPPLGGLASPARLQRIAAAMRGYELIVTHGWEAINAALAHTVFARHFALAPLVHHEAHADPAGSRRRAWARRLALRSAAAVIVPSERLRATALADWQQPASRMRLVPPGLDLAPFARKLRPDALPRLIKRRGEYWLGAFEFGDGTALLDTLALLPDSWQLIWIGEADEPLRAAAMARNLAHRVHTPGALRPAGVFGLLDLVVFDQEPEVTSVIAAMAAGLPIAAAASALLHDLVSPANAAVLGKPVAHYADDSLRSAVGEANRTRARDRLDLKRREAALKAIYDQVIG